MNNMIWKGKKVVILGGARQGLAAARWLSRHGARVTVNDWRSADEMAAAQSSLSGLPINWVFGEHPIDILEHVDALCISGGIPLDNPLVKAAKSAGIPLTNDTQIFMEITSSRTVGITGSAGKTTTTTLVGEMAKAVFGDKAITGGNTGDPLLNHVDNMSEDYLAIMEISSFQLEQMTISPNIAAVLNVTPNHLDRHGTMEAYSAAKRRILDFQSQGDVAVLNRQDEGSWNFQSAVKGKLDSFGINVFADEQDGTFMDGSRLVLKRSGNAIPIVQRDQIQLRGEHNLMNILAACVVAAEAGIPTESMGSIIMRFRSVPHRLEFVRELKAVQWYNDSIATAPERTMVDIKSFNEPIVLILGGRDKNLPWDKLADLVRHRVEHVVLFGEAAGKIAEAIEKSSGPLPSSMDICKSLEPAVHTADRVAEPGCVVLFAPGGTSFDEFNDFEERGKAFRKWVLELS
jgi:UDP-N-acetylmuramoylalanine--D-glutamate ligase